MPSVASGLNGAYRLAAVSAELIDRPLRRAAERSDSDRNENDLRRLLDRIFPDGAEERLNQRLAQLTGLEDDRARDLLKGRNSVTPAWWRFLSDVEGALAGPAMPRRAEQLTFIERLGHE